MTPVVIKEIRPMQKTLAALALGLAAIVAAPAQAEDQKLVTIVATDEPQTQLMAMVLTMQAVSQGADARVLLCGPGADIALIDAPDSATAPQKPKDMSPQSLMTAILHRGVTVEVCAIYLPNKGVKADALIPGVGVAAPPEMAKAMMADDVRLLSF
jgi:predicted peroxiredoxin